MLVPQALGAPVSQEPSPPTLSIMDLANATSPEKLADSGKKIVLGSKGRLHGSASSDEYPALGNGGGHKSKTGTAGDTLEDPTKMGLNRANKMHEHFKSMVDNGVANITLSDGSEGSGTGVSGASKNKAIGSHGITIDTTINGIDNGLGNLNDTGSGASTTGTDTTSASSSTVSGTDTPSPSHGITSSTSKHR